MLARPRLRADLTVAPVPPDRLFLARSERQSLVESAAAVRLAPLLDGTRDLGALLAALPDLGMGPVLGALRELERLDYLVDGPVATSDPTSAGFWDASRVPTGQAAERIAAGGVGLRALGSADPAPLRAALERAGVAVGDPAPDTALEVVLVADHLDPGLEAINRELTAAGRSWVIARLTGLELWLGPHLRPDGPCWACLAEALRANRQLESFLDGHGVTPQATGSATLASTAEAAAGLLATEIQLLLAAGRSARLDGRIVTLDPLDLTLEHHVVVRLPQCPVCGDPARDTRGQPKPLELRPQPKAWTDDGGHRIAPPQETWDRLAHHISPLTGVVTSVRSQNAEDNGVAYSYVSGHNFALMRDSTFFLRKNMRGRSGGKGRTDTQARVGAVCEAIERYAGVHRGPEWSRRASWAELAEGEGVWIEDLLGFSDAQYAGRSAFNAANPTSYHLVPARLEPDRPIHWTAAWSLTQERRRLIPSGYAWYGHPDIGEHFFCASDSNGCAAGNTPEEAVLQGLMELVERDAVALWWYNRVRRPAHDLDALDDPYVDLVRRYHRTLDRETWMLDLTTDLGIPVFAAVSRRHDWPTQDLLIGFGAHVDPHTAALRALTELNQFLPAVSAVTPEGQTHYYLDDPDAIAWWRHATLDRDPYLLPADAPATTAASFASLSTDDISEDVRAITARLDDAGIEVIVLDQSRPEIELSAVKVMAPGLRHFWRRLGRGRLYDVPAQLGWVDAPTPEGDLNPQSIFF